MNHRLINVIAFALVVAGITSFGLYRLILSHVQAPVQKPLGTATIVTATHDLQVGTLIKDSDVHEVLLSGPVSEVAVRKVTDSVGRGVVSPIYRDEVVLATRLANKGAGAGLAAMIPVGMRAVAIPVNEVVGLAGYVSPGVHVDVLVSGLGAGSGGTSGTLCRTILQNIEVLSAGQKIERSVEGKPEQAQVVNLLVSPSQAEIVDLASGQTRVQLVLRNPLDTADSTTTGVSLSKLLGGTQEMPAPVSAAIVTVRHAPALVTPHVVAAQAPDFGTIEVFNGTKRSEQKFELASK